MFYYTPAQLEKIRLRYRLLEEDPQALAALEQMEFAIGVEKRRARIVHRAVEAFKDGKETWIKDVYQSDEHERWMLLGRVALELFKDLKGNQ